MDITLGTLEHREDFQDILLVLCPMLCNFPSMPRKKIFSEDVHDIFKPFGLITWPFAYIAILRPGHFYGESKTNQFYLDHPLTLVRWNNEGEIAALTFKSNMQNFQNIFPIALRTEMTSNLKLYASNSEDWFYYYHLFLGYIADFSGAPNPMISYHSWLVYTFLSTLVHREPKHLLSSLVLILIAWN